MGKNKKLIILIGLLLLLSIIIVVIAINPDFTLKINSDVDANETNENLTLRVTNLDATGLYNITTWYENNISLLLLNMPFTTNLNDVKDYSGYNNNGTISGALWQRYLNEDNNSLVLLMPFDEDNSSTAIDKGDYKNNGVLTNGVALNTTDCVIGSCYSFDGVNDQINITDSNSLDITNAITMEAWIKTNTTDGTIIRKTNSYLLSLTDATSCLGKSGSILVIIGTGSTWGCPNSIYALNGTTSVADNKWHHVVGTFDDSINTINIYVDGALQITKTDATVSFGTNNNNISIGRVLAATSLYPFKGNIDNVRIYNKALTSNEIKDHYEKYKLYYQPSFKFDGVNDYINITNSSSLGNLVDSFSLEVWIRTGDSRTGAKRILWKSQDDDSITSQDFSLLLGGSDNDNANSVQFRSQRLSPAVISATAMVNNSIWHHVVSTYDLSTVRIYVDGVLNVTSTVTGSIPASNTTLQIGSLSVLPAQTFNGSISNVRIYNRSLSANQIYELYNSYNTSGINKLVSEETTAGRTYKAQVYVANSSDIGNPQNTSEILIINTNPLISYLLETQSNNTYINRNYIFINTTITETNLANITFRIFNLTNQFNLSFFTNSTNQINISVDTSGGRNTNYTYNVTIIDLANNQNTSETRTLVLDDTLPIATFLSETEANNTYKNLNYILINVSITETNFANITFRIYNTTGLFNLSFFTNSTNQINISTANTNEKYTYNVTVLDLANNQNTTETRTLTLDTISPTSTLNYPSEGIQFTTSTITFRYSASDTNIANATLFIDNIPLKTNTSLTSGIEDSYKNTTLTNGNHKWYVNVKDLANNEINSTINNFLIDVPTPPAQGGNPSSEPSQSLNQTNQTKNETILQPEKKSLENLDKIIQPILDSTPSSIKETILENKLYFYASGILLVSIGINRLLVKRNKRSRKIYYLPLTFGIGFIFITYNPDYSLYLTKELPDLINKIFPALTISTALIVASVLSILVYISIMTIKRYGART